MTDPLTSPTDTIHSAERAVLAALLLPGEPDEIIDQLRPEDFYSRRHGTVYEAIRQLVEKHGRCDFVLLQEHLSRHGKLEDLDGLPWLMDLAESAKTTSCLREHAELVKDHAIRRRLWSAGEKVVGLAKESPDDIDELVDQAEAAIFEVGEHDRSPTVERQASELVDEVCRGVHDGTPPGIGTGFLDLDRRLSLKPGELIILAGRPSMGKTTIALNMSQHAALELEVPTAFLSLEMSGLQLGEKLLLGVSRCTEAELRSYPDQQAIKNARERISDAPLFFVEGCATAMSIRARLRRMVARRGIGLGVVDYLQLLSSGRKQENRQQEISALSRQLKALAGELQIPIIVLSQLNRSAEQRESHRPRLSDLRESGAIEQDADLVLLLYREEYYQPDKLEARHLAEIIIAKNRSGETGSVQLRFDGSISRFDNLAREVIHEAS